MDGDTTNQLRRLPKVQSLVDALTASAHPQHPPAATLGAARHVIDAARAHLQHHPGTTAPTVEALLPKLAARLEAAARPVLRRVVNATGIVIHTNLGRAPLAPAAIEAIIAAAGPCNLELDLLTGKRGSRTQGVEPLLVQLTGAPAAVAVNNCAAAMLLALSALASGGEVIVSRGELVEIGGGFRIPDIIQQGGARLVEVGTTNRTRLADYERAITPETRILLKVHQSNFAIVGFTEEAGIAELSQLARTRGLLLVHDLGSGAVTDMTALGRRPEETVQQSVAAGSDLVVFSGDKLLGGPQSGLLVGTPTAVDPLRRFPLMRALRLDKLVLAALEATLRLHRDGGHDQIPVLHAIAQSPAELQSRANHLIDALTSRVGAAITSTPTQGYSGGGSTPNQPIPSIAVALAVPHPETLAATLRAGYPAVVARVADGRLLLDMLAIADTDLPVLIEAVRVACPPVPSQA